MSPLAPKTFERRFEDLMEVGRASLPSLAPEWTDHNAHDPGITLMELLAWVAEAQLYSLSHLRRDERAAYAALLGIKPSGTQSASGLIWPDLRDPNSPNRTWTRTVVVTPDTVIHVVDAENPIFRPFSALLWVPGHVAKLETRHANGHTTDHSKENERGDLTFLPFGEGTGRRDVLSMTFHCRDKLGLFGSNRQVTRKARWPIGVLAAPPQRAAAPYAASDPTGRSSLTATLVTEQDRIDLRIAYDSTQGLLTTGTLALDLDDVADSPTEFTIELRAPNGFPRPPRVLRVEPNVIPIRQGRAITNEPHAATGMPDWNFQLQESGITFAGDGEPVTIEVAEPTGRNFWTRCDRLFEHGPNENVYELDVNAGVITFGNGINGRVPPNDAQVLVTYSVSDGEQGCVARNRKWRVVGFEGTFGVNLDPITGGAASLDWTDQRREARRRSREDHALVSSEDIVAAAIALPLLEVARAWVPGPDIREPRTGLVTLVAMRSRIAGKEPAEPPETRQWLETIRRRLTPRMPLGTRLAVRAPRYVEFLIRAVLEAQSSTDPSVIKQEVEKQLRNRLALVGSPGVTPREPGIPLTRRDIAAWLRATEGVKRIVQLELRNADGQITKKIDVGRSGLPRWNDVRSTLDVLRPDAGRSR